MEKSPAALSVGLLRGNRVRDDNGASRGRVEELVIDPDSGHVKNIVLLLGDSRDSGRVRAILWETPRREPEDVSTQRTTSEQVESGAGKPDKGDTAFVYTYSVGRAH